MRTSILKKTLKQDETFQTVLEIGRGFGTLGEVLKTSGLTNFKYIDVDIQHLSYIAQNYLSNVFRVENVRIYEETANKQDIFI
nr:putative sugar O-methyltransferase [Polynucleobacter rarus]